MHCPYGFCGRCFQGPLAPQKTANTAEGGIPGAEKRTQVNLAIETLTSQSVQQDGDLKGMGARLKDTVNFFSLTFAELEHRSCTPGTVGYIVWFIRKGLCVPQSVLGLQGQVACDLEEGQTWVHPGLAVFALEASSHRSPIFLSIFVQYQYPFQVLLQRLTVVISRLPWWSSG